MLHEKLTKTANLILGKRRKSSDVWFRWMGIKPPKPVKWVYLPIKITSNKDELE